MIRWIFAIFFIITLLILILRRSKKLDKKKDIITFVICMLICTFISAISVSNAVKPIIDIDSRLSFVDGPSFLVWDGHKYSGGGMVVQEIPKGTKLRLIAYVNTEANNIQEKFMDFIQPGKVYIVKGDSSKIWVVNYSTFPIEFSRID